MRYAPIAIAFALLAGAPASAQLQPAPTPQQSVGTGIVGAWQGFLRYEARGWALIHRIRRDGSKLFWTLEAFQERENTAEFEIFRVDEKTFFCSGLEKERGSYDYRLVDGQLAGTSRATGCASIVIPML